jgi:HAE1 family hydrophobic/amphiphilic exporter-1
MANTIATPLEKQFTQIPGLELSTSTSSQGNTQITLQFDLSKGIDAAATDVQSAIQRASGQLPSDLPSPPTFTKNEPERSAGDVRRPNERHRERRRALSLRHDQVSQRINILPGVRRSTSTE